MIGQFFVDRERARAAKDPWAELCVLASLDDDCPRLRILVLRDLDVGLGIFYSAHSSKAAELANTPHTELLTYWQAIKVQYRLCVTLTPLPREVIDTHWPRRPPVSKALDWLYETHPQGGVIDTDDSLDNLLEQSEAREFAPPGASGAMIEIVSLERLQLDAEGRHLRERFSQAEGHRERLVP